MAARSVWDKLIPGGTKTLGASETNTVISRPVPTTATGAYILRCEFKVSGVTSTTGITAKLQHFVVDAWVDVTGADAQQAITTNGNGDIVVSPWDTTNTYAADLPLGSQVRLVCSTGASDAVTFTAVRFIQGS